MLRPQGYANVLCDDGRIIERDSIVCGHCNVIVLVKPGTAATVYWYPQMYGPPKEEAGAHCSVCDKPVCLRCHDLGVCAPLLKQIEQMEAKGRFLKAVTG